MSDTIAQTPEAVAFELFKNIASAEGKTIGTQLTDRAYILSTYAECLRVVKGE